MKKNDDSLQRLLRAASLAHKETPASLPAAVESRVLAEWRSTGTEDEFAFLVGLFRQATVFASCVMVLSIGWSWVEIKKDNLNENALVNYAMTIQLSP